MNNPNQHTNDTAEALERLRAEIFQQKEAVTHLHELVKHPIDRDFPVNLWDLTERELDHEMGNRLSFLNDDIDPRPTPDLITSHRKILGKPIVFMKRLAMKLTGFYTRALMEKQRRFNEQVVAFQLASFIRARHIEDTIKTIETKLKTLDEDRELIFDRLETINHESTGPETH